MLTLGVIQAARVAGSGGYGPVGDVNTPTGGPGTGGGNNSRR